MTLEEIKNLPIREISEKDCALFLWVTMPMLAEGLQVIEAWGIQIYHLCIYLG